MPKPTLVPQDPVEAVRPVYEQLLRVRASKTVALKPIPLLRSEIQGLSGKPEPFNLRYYQCQGVYHLLKMPRMVLGDDTGLGKCVTGDTLLVTDRGLLPIRELAPERELRDDTFYEPRIPVKIRTGNGRDLAEVHRFYWCGQKETRKVTTRNGFQIEGSLVHPVLVRGPEQTNEAMKELPELRVGQDYICIDRGGDCFPTHEPVIPFNAKTRNLPVEMTPDLARLLGYVVAEAWTNGHCNVNTLQHKAVDPEVHDDIRGLLASIFDWVGDAGSIERDKPVTSIQKFLEACGVNYATPYNKEVPWSVLRATRLSVRGFLRGLFEGEASVTEGGVEFSSSSERLVRTVQLLLLRFGLVSTLSPKQAKSFEHTYWRLTLFGENARIFDQEIGFISKRKQADLRAELTNNSNPNEDVVPYMGPSVAALKEAISKTGSGLKQYGESFQSALRHVIHGHRNPTYRFLRQLLEIGSAHGLQNHTAFLEIQSVVQQHYFYDPVVSVEKGSASLMDVEVRHPGHRFSGNGFVNHNTVEVIAALCYLWATQEPDNLAIVVAPKSALRQWADEIRRFTTDVKPIVAVGTLGQRKEAYQRFFAGKGRRVLLLNYNILCRDWIQDRIKPLLPNGKPDPKQPAVPGLFDGMTTKVAKDLVVVFDECFDYHTPVLLADGTTELIGRIVCKKLPVEVLSWNWEKGCAESQRVIRWLRNPLKGGTKGQDRRTSMLKLSFRFANSCRVTRNHNFYRPDGSKIQAGDLKAGDITAHMCLNTPTEAQVQAVLGSLLGNASVSFLKRDRWGVTFAHEEAQKEYLAFKYALLEPLGVSVCSTEDEGVPIHRFRLDANVSLCAQYRPHDGTSVGWLDALKPLGLAFWYADMGTLQEHVCTDGTVSKHIVFNTQGLTMDSANLLTGLLRWRWGILAEVRPTAKGPTIYLAREATEKFLSLLPGGFPGVMHKFPGKPCLRVCDFDTKPYASLVSDQIVKVEPWHHDSAYVYNLEVEGNHNYVAGGTLVGNCTAFKNMRTKTWEICRYLADKAQRVYGLTATLLKNNLMEGFSIFKCVRPEVFTTKTAFLDTFCVVKMQPTSRGTKIPIVVGYRNLDLFRNRIDPFFLGRSKHTVSNELPTLTTKEIRFEITALENSKYQEALQGVLELGDGELKEYEDHRAFVSLVYCQQVVNSLSMLRFQSGDEIFDGETFDGIASKEQALIDLVSEELDGEKVIVYTRFESHVARLQQLLDKAGVKSVRITGKEKDDQRRHNQQTFQNPDHPVRVVFITDAGSEAINLQAASAMIFYDAPWSWGNYVQIIGRMIRIGSPHKGVLVYHLIAERPGEKPETIDGHVLTILRRKKSLIERVIGEAAVGVLDFDESVTRLLVRSMQGERNG